MTANKPRFDVKTLLDLAGDKVFARGEAYFRSGQVSVLSIGPQRVLAEVAGSEDYRTRMAGLRDAAEKAAYVAGLKARYGRRRNFMKLLP